MNICLNIYIYKLKLQCNQKMQQIIYLLHLLKFMILQFSFNPVLCAVFASVFPFFPSCVKFILMSVFPCLVVFTHLVFCSAS